MLTRLPNDLRKLLLSFVKNFKQLRNVTFSKSFTLKLAKLRYGAEMWVVRNVDAVEKIMLYVCSIDVQGKNISF